MQKLKVYLAGPDVFLRDPKAIAARKKAICAAAGFTGVSPLDNDITLADPDPAQNAMTIARENEKLMDSCDLIIAHMTPFRGPSMDVGTAYEMGYMRGRGNPVFGYSNDGLTYFEKVKAYVAATKAAGEPEVHPRAHGHAYEDNKSMQVENFGLLDNLMLEGAVRADGSHPSVPDAPVSDYYIDLGAFHKAVAAAKHAMEAREAKAMNEERRKLLTDEWASCRTALGAFDKILVDIRQYGFSLITLLLSANGYLFAQSMMPDFAKVGIYFALLVLIIGLFRQDRIHEVFVRSVVLRAMEIEDEFKTGITFQISYWSERVKTGTWGQWLYHGFCLANFVLVAAGVTATEFTSNPGLEDFVRALQLNWLALIVSTGGLIAAMLSIYVEHRKSASLNTKFTEQVNARAGALGLPVIS